MLCTHWFYSISCFFFKQKTAYEMRISDWSSDVCSSDLRTPGADAADRHGSGDRRGAGGSGGCRGAPESGRLVVAGPAAHPGFSATDVEIGRASCRERVVKYL